MGVIQAITALKSKIIICAGKEITHGCHKIIVLDHSCLSVAYIREIAPIQSPPPSNSLTSDSRIMSGSFLDRF